MTMLDKSNTNSFTIVFCCIALFLSCQISAEGQPGTSNDKNESASKPTNLVDTTHGYLSGSVEWISKKLDQFFSNETEFETATGSYLRVRGQAVRMEGGDVTYTTNLRSKLILPNTEKKLQLILRNEEEEDEESSDTSPTDAITDNNYEAALRAILGGNKYINIHTDAGVKLRSSLDPFVSIRLSAEKPLDKWKFRFIEKMFWYDSEGLSSYIPITNRFPCKMHVLFTSWLRCDSSQ